jgi:hypothetical protein
MADRKFIIINSDSVTPEMWNDAIESEETARFNNDESKVFLSHRNENKPSSFGDHVEKTLNEMLTDVLINDEWMVDQSEEDIPL